MEIRNVNINSINVTFCLWSIECNCRVVVFTRPVLKVAKSKPKNESFSLNITYSLDNFAFTFLPDIVASSTFLHSSKVSMLSKVCIVFRGNNPSSIGFEKIQIQIIFVVKNYLNTNTNNNPFEKITRIRIPIIFAFKKSPKYEYE